MQRRHRLVTFWCVVVPPRLVPLAALALALAPGGVALAGAPTPKPKSVKGYVVPCFEADGQTLEYVVKPKRCIVSEDRTVERTLVPVTNLRWTTWTTGRAKATGKVHGEGYSGKVTVVASKPKRCSSRRVLFTSVKVLIRIGGESGSIAAFTTTCPK